MLIAQGDLTEAQSCLVLAVIVVMAYISVIVPVLYYFIAGTSAEKLLTGWKTWLVANNTTAMTVVLLILDAKLVGAGLGRLVG